MRAGAIILTLWMTLKLVIALGILFMLLVLGKSSPALLILYGDNQGKGLDAPALATINALAVVANASVATLSILSLVVSGKRLCAEMYGPSGPWPMPCCFLKWSGG